MGKKKEKKKKQKNIFFGDFFIIILAPSELSLADWEREKEAMPESR